MRDFDKVIEAVRRAIPDDFNPDLRVELDKCEKRAAYTPPEMMGRHWSEASVLLEQYIGAPDSGLRYSDEWKNDVLDIWNDEPSHRHLVT